MLVAVILICSLSIPECSPDTAIDVVRTPIESANPSTCFMQAQAYIARSSLADDLAGKARVKIICRHKKPERTEMKIIVAIALALMLTGCASFIEQNACLFPGDETGYSRSCAPQK
jgi:hypothetical protein